MRTKDIERDLKVPKLADKLKTIAEKHIEQVNAHPNSLVTKARLESEKDLKDTTLLTTLIGS